MESVTDWLMVSITAVYVIATVFICKANLKSAGASRDQLEEMKRQFLAENRPIIEVELCYEYRTWYIVRFVNNGKLTAYNVTIELQQEFVNSLPEASFRELLNKQKGKKCIIGVGQHYDLFIGSNEMRGNPDMKPVMGKIIYESRAGVFSDEFLIDLRNYMTFFSADNDLDKLVKIIEKNAAELKGIRMAVQGLGVKGIEEE